MHRRDALRAGLGVGLGLLGVGAAASTRPGSADGYEPSGSVRIDGAKEAVVGDGGRIAFVATTDGYATVDVSSPTRPRVLAERRGLLADREDGPMRGIWDVKVDGDRLLVVGPAHHRESVSGALLVDVSDPAAPERVAVFETGYPIHNAFLADGYAYLTGNDGDRNPLVIVDVRGDDPVEVGRWALADVDPAWEDVSASVRPVHDVWVQDGRAHLPMWDAGTWLVDVSDPASPAAVASVGGRSPEALSSDDREGRPVLTPPGNHHYAAVDESGTLLGIGIESWAVKTDGDTRGGPGGIELWDVADPRRPERLSTVAPPPTDDATYDGTWTTAHNFEFRDGILYSAWYQGGVKRHDVSDPRRPRELTWWRDPDAANFWTARTAGGDGERSFVASSVGDARGSLEGVPARLYAFPDRAGTGGEQGRLPGADSPAPSSDTRPSPERSSADATTRTSTAPDATDRTSVRSRWQSSTKTTSDAAAATGGRRHRTSTAARAPGLGAGSALGAVSAVAWWGRRRVEGE
jgi:hypothetical protein